MKSKKILYISILCALFFCLNSTANAFVSPKRVIIESGETSKAITIYNRSKQAKVYTFEWERRVQLPGGKRVKLKEGETLEGYRPADPYLVYSPRRIIIAPGKFQIVRLFARRSPDMGDGEYRSHILIKGEVLDEAKEQELANGQPTQDGVTGTIRFNAYLSIPVLLRHGKTDLDFKLIDASLGQNEDGQETFSFEIENNSTRSFYSRNAFNCTKADGTSDVIDYGSSRIYYEANNVVSSGVLGNFAEKIKDCQNLVFEMGAYDDFEYKQTQVIDSIKIR